MQPAHCEPLLGQSPRSRQGLEHPGAGQSPARGPAGGKGLGGTTLAPGAESLSTDGLGAPSFRRKRRGVGAKQEKQQLQRLLFSGEICPQTVNKTPPSAVRPPSSETPSQSQVQGETSGRSLSGRHHLPKPLLTVQQNSAKHPAPAVQTQARVSGLLDGCRAVTHGARRPQ